MKIAEIKELKTEELVERLAAVTANLYQMEISNTITPLDSPAQIKHTRRTDARMKTELRSRELNK